MHAVARSIVAVAAALCLVLGATDAALGKKPPEDCRHRFTPKVDELRDALRARADTATDKQEAARYLSLVGKLNRCSDLLENEVSTVAHVAFDMAGGEPIAGFEERLREIADVFELAIEAELGRYDAYLDLVDIPGNRVDKGREVIEEARAIVANAKLQAEQFRRLAGLNSAIHRAAAAKKAVAVKKPPKKCKGRRLKASEFCEGVATTGLFQANLGSGTIVRNSMGQAIAISLDFRYCNGVGEDDIAIELSLEPEAGEQDIAGQGYREGLGFELAMRAGSKAELTAFDLNAGIAEGTFSFSVAGNSVGGGRFRITGMSGASGN